MEGQVRGTRGEHVDPEKQIRRLVHGVGVLSRYVGDVGKK